MVTTSKHACVADLMTQQGIDFEELVDSSGVDADVVVAMIHERYTPSPQQRRRVSRRLGVPVENIVWGHKNLVEEHIHSPI